MYTSGIELPQVNFSSISRSLIPIGSYFVGFDLGNLGKLSKLDNAGTITVIEGAGISVVQSVTGLNTDNTNPLNPIVQISVDGTTITGLGTLASPLVASGGIAGSGLNNYVARWTPNGSTLGTGTIQDNGLTAGVNGLVSNIDFVVGGTTGSTYAFLAEVVAGSLAAIKGQAVDPSATINTAIAAVATNTSTGGTIGGNFNANGLTTGTGDTIGVKVLSAGTLATKYAVQLQDGTEGIGKVLTSVTSDGKANWVTPSSSSSNLQKVITTTYVLTDVDNDYTIFINNGATAISISLGAITIPNFCVGFIQEGSADVTFTGVTNPIGLKSKGQGYQTLIERKLSTSIYYLLGNTKV